MTQFFYKIGENNFIEISKKLESKEVNRLEGMIMAGLEYGESDKDGKMDNKRIESEFPELYKLLKSKH
jgi:hypothetical protein